MSDLINEILKTHHLEKIESNQDDLQNTEDEEEGVGYLFNGVKLMYPLKNQIEYENHIKELNSNPTIIKKQLKSIIYNHNFLNDDEMEVVKRWQQDKDSLEDWYDKSSVDKYLDMDSYLDYKHKFDLMELNKYHICSHFLQTIECKICSKYKYCRNCFDRSANKKYRLYCKECFITKFPNEHVFKKNKTREESVIKYIKEQYSHLNWIFNKPLEGLKLFPDIFLETDDRYLIIEVDENQHEKYEKTKEEIRMHKISEILNNKPLFIIRFNTDAFIDNHGTPNESPWWKYGGELIVKNEKDWNKRLQKLSDKIQYILNVNLENIQFFNIIYLFYNGSKSNFRTLFLNF